MLHRSSPSLRGHMRMASYVAGELIPYAFVWHDPGITPCCKSRREWSVELHFETNESRRVCVLNRYCVSTADLESFFRAQMPKIVLQHNLPKGDIATFEISGRGLAYSTR